ncbi:MAG: hypothetical protein RMJ56_17345 [Gemmataceae bacterium]|nr:hypothetical protein [Gemmata sp.]MDW8199362.1 hypothetical protein [Gemmataceae bacterium]
MPRIFGACTVVGVALLLTAQAHWNPASAQAAAAGGFAGNWKLTLPAQRGEIVILLAFTEKNGQWTGEVLGTSRELGGALGIRKLSVTGDVLRFALIARDAAPDAPPGKSPLKKDPDAKETEILTFEGVLNKDKTKLNGTIAAGGSPQPITLLPSKLTKLDDAFALAREKFAQTEEGVALFPAALELLDKATAANLPVEDARGIIERVNKAASEFGPRWEREFALQLVEKLSAKDHLHEIAITQAKRVERMLTDDDTATTRMAVLDAIVRTLTKAGKADEAKPYLTQIAKLELRDYAEYSKNHPPFKPEVFAGRKTKSDRTAVVEVFTEADLEGAPGVLLAFDGLLKTYKPADVILLQYHVPFEQGDPLMSPDAFDRVKYYADSIRSIPAVFVNGKFVAVRGSDAVGAEKAYKLIRAEIDEGLDKVAPLKLSLSVAKAEKGGFEAKATVADLDKPGEKVMLRWVVAEERVRYAVGNGLRYHHMVVRAMPGGAKGVPLTKKNHEQTVTIDLLAVRESITKFLDAFAKEEGPFPRGDRPLNLRNLKLVAFVQDDTTREILQAVQVDLEAK